MKRIISKISKITEDISKRRTKKNIDAIVRDEDLEMMKKADAEKKIGVKDNVKEYFKEHFTPDIKAGFITSIVAISLAIAFAIASGLPPILGLYTAIIAGILTGLFGGSIFSITGPTGAMTVIILSTVQKFGLKGLLLAGFLAGIMQILFGVLGIGKLITFIPLPVISGFTAGIGIIIFLGQIPNALGINVSEHHFVWDTLFEIFQKIPTTNLIALGITLGTIILLLLLPELLLKNKFLKNIPPSVIPLVLSIALIYFISPSVSVIGELPKGLPSITFSFIDLQLIRDVLPAALTIALLGSIESLLCAVVCDGMSGTKHNPQKELIAQGITNSVLPFFGSMPATAAIARSAVNIREGARTRFAGVFHAIFLLIYMVLLGSLIALVPKAFLAGVLLVISFKMINFHEFKTIMNISKSGTIVLFLTMILTVATNLVYAVEIGVVAAIFFVFVKLTRSLEIDGHDKFHHSSWINKHIYENKILKDKVGVYTINGPFFFGAMSIFDEKVNEHMHIRRPIVILRMNHVPFMDSTGIIRLKEFIADRKKHGKEVFIVGLKSDIKKDLLTNEEFSGLISKEKVFDNTKDALARAEELLTSGTIRVR